MSDIDEAEAERLFNQSVDPAEAEAERLFEAEGGAEGGAADSTPSKALTKPHAAEPIDPAVEKQRRQDAMMSLTHGQGAPLDEQEERGNRRVAGALGEGISVARGVPLTGSHIDELSALLQAHAATGPEYEKKRDEARSAVNEAVKQNPAGPVIGALAFAPAAPATAYGRVGLSTAEGLSEGIGHAKNMSEVPREALIGTGEGFGGGLAAEGLNATSRYLAGKQADVLTKNKAMTDKAADTAFASARGAYGGNVANANNLIQSAERALSDPRLPPEVRDAAKQFLDSPESLALREQVARSNLGRGDDALSRITSSQNAMHEAAAGLTPEARAAAAQKRLDDPSALIRRVRELGPKVLLPMVGGAIAGPAGAGAGALSGAMLGRSATTLRNALADPYVASRVLGVGKTALGGAGRALGAGTPVMSKETLDALQPEEPNSWTPFLQKDEEQK